MTFESAEAGTTDLERLEWLVLGYDVRAASTSGRRADRPRAASAACSGCTPTCARSTARTRDDGDDESLRSPQEYLHAFLRSLDAAAEGLPERFAAALERALAHYGLDGLERTPALEEACYRLFLAQQRAGAARAAVRAILGRRLDARGPRRRRVPWRAGPPRGRARAARPGARRARARAALAPLRRAARRGRPPGDLRDDGGHLAALAEDPQREDREERMTALVACPQPLAPLLGRQIGGAGALVEAMTRRYYRIRRLEAVEQRLVEGVPFVHATYVHDGARHHVAATLGARDDLAAALRALAGAARELPGDERVLADLYARAPGARPRARWSTPRTCRATSSASRSCWRRTTAGSPVDVATFPRSDDGAQREPRPARHAPDDGRADGRLAARELRARAPALRPGRPPLPRGRAREPARRAARRARRGARPQPGARRARPHHRAAAARAHDPPGVRGDALVQSRRRPRERLLWNRLVLYAVAHDRLRARTRRAP